MSDTNIRLECPYCKKTFLTKGYSNHLEKEHLPETFNDKNNRKELEELANKKSGKYFRPVELKVNDKELHYVPCCKKYYSKYSQAEKHNKKKECYEKVIEEAKNTLDKLQPITINNTHNGSGDIKNNTTITNNYNFYDLSGNLIKTICKEVCGILDDDRYNKVSYFKKLEKLKSIFKDHPDYDSDISTIDSAYDTDDESDTKLERIDLNKEFSKYSKKTAKQLLEAKIDLSRKSLGLRTKEDKERQYKEKEEEQLREEQFQKEVEAEERSGQIGNLRGEIISLKGSIKHYEKIHNENLNMMKSENSGITEEIFNKEYCQTLRINKLKKQLEEAQGKLSKLL